MDMSSVARARTRLGIDARLLIRQEELTGKDSFGTALMVNMFGARMEH